LVGWLEGIANGSRSSYTVARQEGLQGVWEDFEESIVFFIRRSSLAAGITIDEYSSSVTLVLLGPKLFRNVSKSLFIPSASLSFTSILARISGELKAIVATFTTSTACRVFPSSK
jgi:hypothetical protein